MSGVRLDIGHQVQVQSLPEDWTSPVNYVNIVKYNQNSLPTGTWTAAISAGWAASGYSLIQFVWSEEAQAERVSVGEMLGCDQMWR